ncbi:MAG: TonB-dependent receptor [Motiliproteus sp.]
MTALKYPLLFGILAISLQAYGPVALAFEEDELLTEDDMLEALPTFKSATNLEQRLSELPASITIIDRKMIKASGAINISDLFRLVPGFQTYHVNANKFGVTSHGHGETHPGQMEVTIDGRSVYISLLSTVDWSVLGIGMDDIDHIEVVRGSNVPTQGSNAFLGAINIVTRSPLQDQGTRISMTRGDLKTQEYSIRHNGQLDKLDYRLSANYHKNNGHGVGLEDGDPSNPLEPIRDDGEISQLSFRAIYTPNLLDNIDVQVGYSEGDVGVGRAHQPDEFTKRDVQTHYQSLVWNRSLAGDDEFKLKAYHNYLEYYETEPFDLGNILGPAAGIFLDFGIEKGVAERYDVSADLTKRLGKNTRSVWSAGVRRESLKSQPLLNRSDTVAETMFRGSSNIEHRFWDNWIVNIGAMLESNDIAGDRLSPRIGINYQINAEHSLRASASKAYRTPSLFEANENIAIVLPTLPAPLTAFSGATYDQIFQADPDMGPEEIVTYEVGYLWQNPRNHWVFDAKLFIEEVDKSLEEFTLAQADLADSLVNEIRNTTHWRTHGVELQLKYQPINDTWVHFAYSYADTEGEHDKGLGGIKSLTDDTPRHTLAILASHNLTENTQVSMAYYRMTSVFWDGGATLDPYKRLDLRLAQDFTYGNTEASVELIVQNLTSNYTEFDVNNTFDTRTFLRLSLGFM